MQQTEFKTFPQLTTVAVVGLGKIGLPLAVQYACHGWHVIGCDINPMVVDAINTGRAHVREEPELEIEVPRLVAMGLLTATLDIRKAVQQASVIVIIVPVIIDKLHNVDFSALDRATVEIGNGLQEGTLVIYESTVPVGTTARRLATQLEQISELRAGEDFHLAYSPERVSSGTIFRDLRIYPKVIGGINEASTRAAENFYRSVLDAQIITMASTEEAEFVKLIETTYRDVNIALANEYASIADMRGLDVAAAIVAANTQPYSHIPMPGVGVGGHCIPVYPYFLLASISEISKQPGPTAMLTLPLVARHINDEMAEYAIRRIESVVGSCAHHSFLILGAAYRSNIREAAFTSTNLLQNALLKREAYVYVDDPLFSEEELRELGYMPFIPDMARQIDAIILQAGHEAYQKLDFSQFTNCRVVLDGRRALDHEEIENLGMHYIAIGDGANRKQKKIGSKDNVVSSGLYQGGI